jgi:hypothetical protein
MVTRNQHLDQRMNWFDRQFLRAQDFADESDYHVDRLRRHLRLLHTPGVGEGLMVRGSVEATAVTVDAGTAFDDQGREIVLLTSTGAIDLPADQTTADLYVGYGEAEAEQSQDPGIVGNTRIQETPQLSFRSGSDPVPGSGVLLARLALADGKLTAEPDNTVKTMAGAAIGDVSVFSLTLRPVGQPSTVWPRLTASGANQVSLAGDLNVHGSAILDGDLTMGATKIIAAPGRLHIAGEELLFLLNKAGVIVSKAWGGNGTLKVDGLLTALSGLQLGGAPPVGEFSRDPTLSAASDAAVPTEQAVKSYVDRHLHIEVGNVAMQDLDPQGGSVDKPQAVKFATPFASPPPIFVSAHTLDAERDHNLVFDVFPNNVSPTGFDLVFRALGDTKINVLGANWLAFGPLP